ncbi:MAG: sigma-54 dependent transcriptional regulator [bacterium]
MKRLVLVEDRETTRVMLAETLKRRGWEIAACGSLAEGRAALSGPAPAELLLTDLQLPDGSGLDLLREGVARDPLLPVLVISAYGTIEIAVEAMKAGAYDFVTKPFDTKRLVELVERALERRPRAADAARAGAPFGDGEPGLLGESPLFREAVRQARRVAPSDATVVLLGESGTGKELFARAIHRWSGRADGPLVSVNCAAIPSELMEAEFFGSERGAFTGSVSRKIGKVEAASGGTLFLDEIGELSAELQAKLLRVLQERAFVRVGGTDEIHSDIRVVCATNSDLAAQVREGRFREDLFYRLHVFPIRVPSLRERPGDVARLAEAFLEEARTKEKRPALRLTEAAMAALGAHLWPGNVRELKNAIERAVILAEGDAIGAEHLPALGAATPAGAASEEDLPLLEVGRRAQREAEHRAIRRALEASGGNRTEAAKRLGVSYKTLWSKLKEFEIGEER